jgi:hypothetical protein
MSRSVIFLSPGSYLWYANWKNEIMRFPPKAPSELVAKPLSSTKIQLNWKDNSNNELGFMLYRNGQKLPCYRRIPESTLMND